MVIANIKISATHNLAKMSLRRDPVQSVLGSSTFVQTLSKTTSPLDTNVNTKTMSARSMEFEAVGASRRLVASATAKARKRVEQLLKDHDAATQAAILIVKEANPDISDYGANEELGRMISCWALDAPAKAIDLHGGAIKYKQKDLESHPYEPFSTFTGAWCTNAAPPPEVNED